MLKLSEIPIMHLHFAPAGFILINLIQIKVDFCRHVIIVFLSVGICSNPQSEVFLVQKGRIFLVLTICQKKKLLLEKHQTDVKYVLTHKIISLRLLILSFSRVKIVLLMSITNLLRTVR